MITLALLLWGSIHLDWQPTGWLLWSVPTPQLVAPAVHCDGARDNVWCALERR